MNIHHLELFYYVARHGGIAEAVRNIPYGIQQPAVSGQIAQLEEFLGTTLFHRRPFELTPAGEKLYHYIEPFFSGLDTLAAGLQGGEAHQIRVGASDIILRDHLPEILLTVRRAFPRLRVHLREGSQNDLETRLQHGEIDLAITLVDKKSPVGIRSEALLELPLALVVPCDSPLTRAEELWKQDRIEEQLICLPAAEAICKQFQRGLARLGVDWFPGLEVNSVDLIENYVANGFGIGLNVAIPKVKMSPKVRLLPLPGFEPVVVGMLWRGKPTAVVTALIREFQSAARRLKD